MMTATALKTEERKQEPRYTAKDHKKLVREARRNGWKQITWRTNKDARGVRNGWLVEDTGRVMRIRLVGEGRTRRIPQKERDFVKLV